MREKAQKSSPQLERNNQGRRLEINRKFKAFSCEIRYKRSNARSFINFTHIFYSALHVSPVVKDWNFCSGFIGNTYRHEYQAMNNFYKTLLNEKIRILVYNGDLDLACNFLGDQWFVDSLKEPLKRAKRPWLITVRTNLQNFQSQ